MHPCIRSFVPRQDIGHIDDVSSIDHLIEHIGDLSDSSVDVADVGAGATENVPSDEGKVGCIDQVVFRGKTSDDQACMAPSASPPCNE